MACAVVKVDPCDEYPGCGIDIPAIENRELAKHCDQPLA